MKNLYRQFRVFWQLPSARRFLIIEATVWLGISRFKIVTMPFKRIFPRLGKHLHESANEIDEVTRRQAQQIGWAVRTISAHTPWTSNCLPQAMAAKRMLQRRGISSTLYIGMGKNEKDGFAGHAWLRCGSVDLTGGSQKDQFTVLSTFAETES